MSRAKHPRPVFPAELDTPAYLRGVVEACDAFQVAAEHLHETLHGFAHISRADLYHEVTKYLPGAGIVAVDDETATTDARDVADMRETLRDIDPSVSAAVLEEVERRYRLAVSGARLLDVVRIHDVAERLADSIRAPYLEELKLREKERKL